MTERTQVPGDIRPGEPSTRGEADSRVTTDGTRVLVDTYQTSDGTVSLPETRPEEPPLPEGRRRRLPDHFPIGDPRQIAASEGRDRSTA